MRRGGGRDWPQKEAVRCSRIAGKRTCKDTGMSELAGLEFDKSQRAVESRKKRRKLVAKSSVVPRRPSRLRDWWWWWWWWWWNSIYEYTGIKKHLPFTKCSYWQMCWRIEISCRDVWKASISFIHRKFRSQDRQILMSSSDSVLCRVVSSTHYPPPAQVYPTMKSESVCSQVNWSDQTLSCDSIAETGSKFTVGV